MREKILNLQSHARKLTGRARERAVATSRSQESQESPAACLDYSTWGHIRSRMRACQWDTSETRSPTVGLVHRPRECAILSRAPPQGHLRETGSVLAQATTPEGRLFVRGRKNKHTFSCSESLRACLRCSLSEFSSRARGRPRDRAPSRRAGLAAPSTCASSTARGAPPPPRPDGAARCTGRTATGRPPSEA